jgi:hypothetical protein
VLGKHAIGFVKRWQRQRDRDEQRSISLGVELQHARTVGINKLNDAARARGIDGWATGEPRGPGAPISATSLPAHLSFVNGAERSRALHIQSSGTSHMDQNLENLIRERAYEIWTSHGCVHGQADQHWLAAEREILTASTATLPGKPGPQKKRPLPARSKITKTLARAG